MSGKLDNIPETIARSGLFCVWRYEEIDGRVTKVLYQPERVSNHARTNDYKTFSSFEKAREALCRYKAFDGIGLHISKDRFDGVSAIDIDHCIDEDGVISEQALYIVKRMNSYTERSPSGKGLRVLFKVGRFDYDRTRYYIMNHPKGLEVYVSGVTNKFVTLTGDVIYQGVNLDEEKGEALKGVLELYMKRAVVVKKSDTTSRSSVTLNISDEDLISKACKVNPKFCRLWNGDLSDYLTHDKTGRVFVDHSSGDLALCGLLMWWTNGDRSRVERLFYSSKLYREKWERDDYRRSTLDRAEDLFDGKGYDPDYYKKNSSTSGSLSWDDVIL